jgi:hypothetical protein
MAMLLPGRLSTSTLGDLLGMLHRERTTGRLELHEIARPTGRGVHGRIHRVHLWDGLVSSVETSIPVPRLGDLLRREGLVGDGALRRLDERIFAGDPRQIGEILIGEGLASGDAIRAALRLQTGARLDALFGLEDATIAFRGARPSPFAYRIPPLGPSEFLHGRARTRDRGRTPPPPRASEGPPQSGPRPRVASPDDARDHAARLLGVPREAGTDEIRRAFRRLAAPLHPDAAPAGEAEQRIARIAQLSAAYHLLVA